MTSIIEDAFAELLVKDFPETQLIVLTHDQQFHRRLMTVGGSWQTLELISWDYHEGPRTRHYETSRTLDAARRAGAEADVTAAATKTRRALEELLQEACEGLEAPLAFRRGAANDRRELVELLDSLRANLKRSAPLWLAHLNPLLKGLLADTQAALNVESHASRGWASRQEIAAALGRVEQLDAAFGCSSCHSRIWVVGGSRAAHCRCGLRHFPPNSAELDAN